MEETLYKEKYIGKTTVEHDIISSPELLYVFYSLMKCHTLISNCLNLQLFHESIKTLFNFFYVII